MDFKTPLFLLFVLGSTSQALKFDIGGTAGWSLKPSENYNEWSGRNSGTDQNCEKGQKLNLVVISPRGHTPSSAAPSLSTTTHLPQPSPFPNKNNNNPFHHLTVTQPPPYPQPSHNPFR
ncbi:unnamed protein product [Vicia faba]|uniref:Uncharacterized protein n=1 Tax=Vicia faba TaxID=3906 RepID=A0AAV0YD97_VICFA|nr:unnamed protein product [Vicia faba]